MKAVEESECAAGWNEPFNFIERSEGTPSVEELDAGRLPELNACAVDRLEADWIKCVAGKGADSICG